MRALTWVLVILPAAITSTAGPAEHIQLCFSLAQTLEQFHAASCEFWTRVLLNKSDYTC